MECVANSCHQPLCLLHLPSVLATNCAGWVLLLAPSGWVRRIQLCVAVRVGIRSNFSLSSHHLITVVCGVEISSPQILSLPLPAFLTKGGMVRAVSPWYLVEVGGHQ